jgi:hypothetical protein
MTARILADKLAAYLKQAIKDFPDGFYDSMAFMRTGNNLCHPITWGLLAQFTLTQVKNAGRLGIDIRLNTGMKKKFQPDIVACTGELTDLKYLFFIDYESPNSSDSRPIYKDIVPYLAWSEQTGFTSPYIVITTLPKRRVGEWPKWDIANKGEYKKLLRNPFDYWYKRYRQEFASRKGKMGNVAVLNLDGKRVKREFPD